MCSEYQRNEETLLEQRINVLYKSFKIIKDLLLYNFVNNSEFCYCDICICNCDLKDQQDGKAIDYRKFLRMIQIKPEINSIVVIRYCDRAILGGGGNISL